jgi:hypothetical protein
MSKPPTMTKQRKAGLAQAALRNAGSGPKPFDPRRAAPADVPAGHDHEIALLVGSVGNLYGRYDLSSPSQLRAAASHWLGLDLSEIVEAIEIWLDDNRQRFVSGSGDAYFAEVEGVIRRLWEQKHGAVAGGAVADPEPAPRPRGHKRVYQPSGVYDGFDYDGVSVSSSNMPPSRIDRQPEDYADVSGLGEDLEDDA